MIPGKVVSSGDGDLILETMDPRDGLVNQPITLSNFRGDKYIVPDKDRFGICRSVSEFEKLMRIGEGSYGVVYKAKDTKKGGIVALKRIRFEREGEAISQSAIREITILQQLKHPNIIRLMEVVVGKDPNSIFLVMEYCESDLGYIVDNNDIIITEPHIKCIMLQLFKGVDFLHSHFIIHRDLKACNLLMDKGILKIADFGLARSFTIPYGRMTPQVVTLWYRAPEVLFGSKIQTKAIDMWAAGCIMGELFLRKAMLKGKSEMEQIGLIIDLIGTPNEKIWPGFNKLPSVQNFTLKHQPYNQIKLKFPQMSGEGHKLMNHLFMYDPHKRFNAAECSDSTYFKETPLPCDPILLPNYTKKLY